MRYRQNYFVVLLFVLWLLVSTLSAQVYPFYNYSIDEGLPQSSAFCLYQDNNNYLWIGTDGGGAVRFDGNTFSAIDSRMGLPGNVVRSIHEDSRGLIWFGTDNGLAFFDGKNTKVLHDSLAINNTSILDIAEDKNKNLWIATNNQGVYQLKFEEGKPISLSNISKDQGLLSNLVMDIEIDSLGQIWLAMYGGINVINIKDDKITIASLEQYFEIPSMFVLSIFIDDNGVVWCGSYDVGAFKIESLLDYRGKKAIELFEINRFSKRIWKVYGNNSGSVWFGTESDGAIKLSNGKVESYTKENGLNGEQILDILTDKEGITWFASMTNGITKFFGNHFMLFSDLDPLLNPSINAVAKFEGKLLLGTKNGLVFLNYNNNKISVEKIELSQYSVTSIATKDDEIWVGTMENGVCSIGSGGAKTFINTNNGLPDNYINCLNFDNDGILWVGTRAGICKLIDPIFIFDKNSGLIDNEVQDLHIDAKGRVWIATLGGLAYIDKDEYRDFDETEGLDFKKIHCLEGDAWGNIYIGTYGGGVYIYNDNLPDSLKIRNIFSTPSLISNNIYSLSFLDKSNLIIGSDKGFNRITISDSSRIKNQASYDKMNGFIGTKLQLNSLFSDAGLVMFGTATGLMVYNPELEKVSISKPIVLLKDVQLFNETIDWREKGAEVNNYGVPLSINLKHKDNHISFIYEGVSFRNPNRLAFRYKLDGVDKDWSPKTSQKRVTYSGLSHGNFTFHVKIIDENDETESSISIPLSITPPIYKTPIFYFFAALLIILLFIAYNRYRTAKLRKDKRILKQMVDERTYEIKLQKEKIEIQRDEIQVHRKDLTDSIEYAEKIQLALMPEKEQLSKAIDNFIFFRPKDIVSGDFYWFGFQDDKIFVSIADCTGHGVPGAFMSMLGIRLLNEIVFENKVHRPDRILTSLRDKVIQSLHQDGRSTENKDGMDISICVINPQTKTIQFAGANNSLYHVRDNEIFEFKADRMPVSIHPRMDNFNFIEFEYQTADSIYLYSDGYIDQFGGDKGKKFKRGAFKSLLLSIAAKNVDLQHDILAEAFSEWQGNYEQIDDVAVMGIKF